MGPDHSSTEPTHCSSETLEDLAESGPIVTDSSSGFSSGVRLVRPLGAGGMSTVFLAERVAAPTGPLLGEETPRVLAMKFLQPLTAASLDKFGVKPLDFVKKEVVALQRLSSMRPRPANVIDYYGCGEMDVVVRGRARRLPWIAVELVEGGNAGLSLADRVMGAVGGVDPVRALRLVRGIAHGLAALHSVGVIHRDLKPENVLVSGPVDDEQPKLSDCGIARVSGIETSLLAAVTPQYGGIEQFLPASAVGNPLIGAWTDVHAFAAVVWFILGGEQWHRDLPQQPVSLDWVNGDRRSLRTASRLHPALAGSNSLGALDAVLCRGASARLPSVCAEGDYAKRMQKLLLERFPAAGNRPERYADLASFVGDLDPILAGVAEDWRKRAGREQKPATQFRPTIALSPTDLERLVDGYVTKVHPPERLPTQVEQPLLSRGLVAHYPDGSSVARGSAGLLYLRDRRAHTIQLPPDAGLVEIVRSAIRLLHADPFGCAIVSPKRVAFVRANTVSYLEAPQVAGRMVGDIVSAHRYGGRLAVVTDETEDSEGASELWWTADGRTWSEPSAVVLNGGRALASSEGPYGSLVVGLREGKRVSACAAFIGNDGRSTSYAKGLGAIAGLRTALSGLESENWAASGAAVVRFTQGAVVTETVDPAPPSEDDWADLSLDLVGVPWLLMARAIFRREVRGDTATWRCVHAKPGGEPPFVSMSFTPDGAFALDAHFNTLQVTPSDIQRWTRR